MRSNIEISIFSFHERGNEVLWILINLDRDDRARLLNFNEHQRDRAAILLSLSFFFSEKWSGMEVLSSTATANWH